MSYFEDFLKSKVATEDLTIFEKYPDLKESISKMESDLATTARFAGAWVNWQNQNWDPEAGMTKAEKQLRDELADTKTRLDAAAANPHTSPKELEEIRKEFKTQLDEQQRQSLAAIEGMNMFYRSSAKYILSHQQEFKENFDPQNLMEFMNKNRIVDPDLAYSQMVAGKRAELAAQAEKDRLAEVDKKIAEAEQRGYQKHAQEAAMGPNGMLPTDQTGGIVGVTGRMDKPAAMSDEVKAKMADSKLGDGSLAALGYQMYLKGELPGTPN